jgi:hypothetical protein
MISCAVLLYSFSFPMESMWFLEFSPRESGLHKQPSFDPKSLLAPSFLCFKKHLKEYINSWSPYNSVIQLPTGWRQSRAHDTKSYKFMKKNPQTASLEYPELDNSHGRK